jgi:hypothetical protein
MVSPIPIPGAADEGWTSELIEARLVQYFI